jgi:RNA polymerase sigma-70 factor (ECF subfamily)
VAEQAMTFRRFTETSTRILVNGIPGGVAWAPDGSPFAILALTVRGGRIVAIDVLADPDRLGRLDLGVVAR